VPLKVVPLRDRKLHRQVKKAETRPLRRGEVLFSEGDASSHLILVRTGHVQLVSNAGTSEERVVAIAGPWEMTGEEALFPGTRRRTGARAGEKALVSFLDGDAVNRALRTGSKTYGAFLLAKEDELSLARALGGPKRSGGAANHLGALLLHLAGRLGRSDDRKGVRIPIRLTHQVLADLSGCHRSTVTTLLNDWIYEGTLKQQDGELRILKPGKLGP